MAMRELYSAIWRVSGKQQVILIALSISIAALAAAPLKFQQEIINRLTEPSPAFEQLLFLGVAMLAVIVFSLGLKWILGYRAGILGENITRNIRNLLYSGSRSSSEQRIEVPTGTLTTAVNSEAEELGKFTGSAFSEPLVQVGSLISVVGFIAATQPGLGKIAIAMVIPQVFLVLYSQRKVNTLVKERVRLLRGATDQITMEGVSEVTQRVVEDFDAIYETRRSMFQWKLSTKFVLSTINGAGTVAVLILGSWLVIQQQTDVGTVVAATAGLSRLQGPTNAVIAFYRLVSATRVKYELLLELLPQSEEPANPGT